jgi:drug/metabolite transporter (DMT)-like permease
MLDSGRPRQPSGLPIVGLLLLNLALLAGQAAFGKEAALRQEAFSAISIAWNPYYLATLACLAGHAVVWPLVLRRAPLAFAYGVMTLQYPLVLLLSRIVFDESVTLPNVAGTTLILGGVLLLSLANARQA